MAEQRSVNVPTNIVADGVRGEEEEEEETKAFLFQYLSRRAQNDQEMAGSDVEVIQRGAARSAIGADDTDAATNLACMLADLGEFFREGFSNSCGLQY